MGRKCCAYGCKTGYDSQQAISVDQLITVHCYPIKNKELCEKWVLAANPMKDFKPTINSGLCSLHFRESDFVEYSQDKNSTRRKQNGEKRALCRRYLKKDAIPSVFQNAPAYVSRKPRPSSRTKSKNRLGEKRKQLATVETSFAADDDVFQSSLSEIHDEMVNEPATPKGFQMTILKGEKCNFPLKMTGRGEHFMNIAETLVKYRENDFLCDAVLVSKCGRELKAHSALLAAVSPVLLMAIEEKPSSGPYHLCFPEVEFDVLEIAVHYVYTGKLLLPTVYSQMDQLSLLFNKLSDLGLSLHKLHECEMTFVRSAKQPPNSSNSVNAEDANNKTSLKDSVRKLQVSSEWPVDKTPSSAEAFKEEMITDVVPNDARTSQARGDSKESRLSDLAKQKGQGNRDQEQPKRKHRKTGNKNSKKKRMPSNALDPTTLHAASTGSRELNNLPVGLLLDQNVAKINTLDSDNYDIHDTIVNDSGEPTPKTKGDILNSIEPLPTEGTLGPNVIEKVANKASISTNQVLTCKHCAEPNAEFVTEIELFWHKIKHHWDQCNVCDYCGRGFSSRKTMKCHIKRHLGIYPKKNHKCNDCGKCFISPDRLKIHRVRHTGEKPHECPDCRKRFTLQGNMERHQLLHSGHYPFLCDFCGKGFTRNTGLTNHVTLHHDFECVICSCKQTSKADMEKHALEVHQLGQLVKFNSIIKNRRTYLCDLCGKNCISACSLQFHIKGHRKKPFHCETCGKKFSKLFELRLHMRVHTGERPFLCDVCQKGFTQKSMLMMHLTIHSGIKPYDCVICSNSFASKSQLKEHMKHHMMTHSDKKLFKCEICYNQFTSKAHLIVHNRIHTGERPYKCRICSKQFISKSTLTIHIRTHTGDKPFVCTVCEMSFTQSQHLTRHMRTHTGEKPFVCEICSKSYKNKVDLRYHFMRFHKIDVTLNSLSENIDIDRKVKAPDTSVCIVDELKVELDS